MVWRVRHRRGTSSAFSGDYFVTKLDRAILRMVDIELSGSYREPEAADVLRTGGDPRDGTCTVSAGTVQIF